MIKEILENTIDKLEKVFTEILIYPSEEKIGVFYEYIEDLRANFEVL